MRYKLSLHNENCDFVNKPFRVLAENWPKMWLQAARLLVDRSDSLAYSHRTHTTVETENYFILFIKNYMKK